VLSNAYHERDGRIDMSEQENSNRTATDSAARLPTTLRLGAVHLRVSDLERSVVFYEEAIGLKLHHRKDGVAAMGVGEEALLELYEEPGVRRAGRHAGLYHYALLFPSREELARAALRVAATKTPIQGASDHGTHEAIYLPDPDGNGIELAADRPREAWPKPLDYAGGPHPLDLNGLLTAVSGEEPRAQAGPGLRIGHVHLHVGDLERGLGFYRDLLGFELMTFMPGAAAFVSAGGYHHHLGFNLWRGEGIPPAPEGRVGLQHWTVVLEEPEEVAAVRERVQVAGIEVEEGEDHGFLVRDPWDIATVFTRNSRRGQSPDKTPSRSFGQQR
jgi:catechol 2,3-dioxygenase